MENRTSRKLKSLLAFSLLGAMASDSMTPGIYGSEPRRKKSEPQSTLNGTQKSKRSKRNKLQKQSRKQNRK